MPQLIEETINSYTKVQLIKELYEVTTQDHVPLILTRKRPANLQDTSVPVLLIHGLGQNRFTWDLSKRSMANYLVKNGFDVYIAELRGHGLSRANGAPYPKSFEDYSDYDCPALIQFIRNLSGHDKIFLMGHSLGGTITYCLSATQQQYIKGVIPIGAPSHFGRGAPLIKNLARFLRVFQKYTPINKMLPDYFLIDYVGVLTNGVIDLLNHPKNQLLNHLFCPESTKKEILIERIEKGFDRTGTAIIGIMVKWGKTQRFLSSCKERDYEAMLEKVTLPILFITGDQDTACPYASIEIAHDRISSQDKSHKEFGLDIDGAHFGHLDLICGDAAPEIVWPFILNWLQQRTGLSS